MSETRKMREALSFLVSWVADDLASHRHGKPDEDMVALVWRVADHFGMEQECVQMGLKRPGEKVD